MRTKHRLHQVALFDAGTSHVTVSPWFSAVFMCLIALQEVTSVSSVSRQNSRSGDRGASKVPRPRTKHGHKTDYLFGSLPPVPQRFERQAASCTQEQ